MGMLTNCYQISCTNDGYLCIKRTDVLEVGREVDAKRKPQTQSASLNNVASGRETRKA
jgi:hypothetical protein